MEYRLLREKLENTVDIYSFMVELFMFLNSTSVPKLKSEYRLFCDQGTNVLRSVRALTEIAPYSMGVDFPAWKNEWLDLLGDNIQDYKMICFQTLMNLDNIIPSLRKKKINGLIKCGPLNEHYQQESFIYTTVPKAFFDTYFKNEKIRFSRQTVAHDATGLNSLLDNIHIVRKSSTNDYIPTVDYYEATEFSKEEITIGCSAINDTPWFKEESGADTDTFCVKYVEEKKSEQNKRLINLIELFDSQKVDIVTFPELALNESSLRELSAYLAKTELRHVKIIFTGSCWDGNKNEAYILSSAGSVLMRYQKKKPFQYYDKKKKTYISENIVSDPYIRFLDIPGIGRISYCICYDYNNDDVEAVCSSVMQSNFMFVAVYSNDTALMAGRANANASLRGITTVLTNACVIAQDGHQISYIVAPSVNERHLYDRKILDFKKGHTCKACEFCIKTGVVSTKTLANPAVK